MGAVSRCSIFVLRGDLGGSLRAKEDAPYGYKKCNGELEEEERDDDAFAPWRVYARRAGDIGHAGHVGLEKMLGSN